MSDLLIELVQDQTWAIHPAKLDEINVFIQARLSGEKLKDIETEFAEGKSGNKAKGRYQIQEGVAVIPVFGTLMKRANVFTRYSGGTSYQLLQRDIESAMNDSLVKGVVAHFDTPGGTTDGVFDAMDTLRQFKGKKPMIAMGDGMITSAGYLLGSVADHVMISQSTYAGSIGVYSVHYDYSKNDEMRGIKRTEITAGKYKAAGSDVGPMSAEHLEYQQGKVDYLYGMFLDAVSKNRSVDMDKTLSMADGKIFIGSQALDVGLVDSVGTLAQAIGLARPKSKTFFMKGPKMTLEELKAQEPALYDQVLKLGADSVSATLPDLIAKAKAEGEQAGLTVERERVTEILSAEGDPDLTKKAITEGMSAKDAFKAFLQGDKKTREEALKDMKESLSEGVGHSAKPKKEASGDAEAYMTEVDAYQEKHKCSRTKALLAIATARPELHKAYLLSAQKKGD